MQHVVAFLYAIWAMALLAFSILSARGKLPGRVPEYGFIIAFVLLAIIVVLDALGNDELRQFYRLPEIFR